MPKETMSRILGLPASDLHESADYVLIRDFLLKYQKLRDDRSWDEFRKKIKPETILGPWEQIITECARNGFVNPWVTFNGKIVWHQVTTNGDYHTLDLCTMCERPCGRREDIDTGKEKWKRQHYRNYQEPKACWQMDGI